MKIYRWLQCNFRFGFLSALSPVSHFSKSSLKVSKYNTFLIFFVMVTSAFGWGIDIDCSGCVQHDCKFARTSTVTVCVRKVKPVHRILKIYSCLKQCHGNYEALTIVHLLFPKIQRASYMRNFCIEFRKEEDMIAVEDAFLNATTTTSAATTQRPVTTSSNTTTPSPISSASTINAPHPDNSIHNSLLLSK